AVRRGRPSPSEGRAAASALCRERSRGRGLLEASPGGGPPAEGEVVGAAGSDQPGTALAEEGKAGRGPRAARRALRLVHRGVRYCHSARGPRDARHAAVSPTEPEVAKWLVILPSLSTAMRSASTAGPPTLGAPGTAIVSRGCCSTPGWSRASSTT